MTIGEMGSRLEAFYIFMKSIIAKSMKLALRLFYFLQNRSIDFKAFLFFLKLIMIKSMQSCLADFLSASLLQLQPHVEPKHKLLIRSEVLPLDYKVFLEYLQHD